MTDTKLTRIGIFYDGGYFAHVSDYYLYHHVRKARISIQGLHALLRDEVARAEQNELRYCHIVEAHYFRGRFSADDAKRHDATRPDGDSTLYRERKFEDALIKSGVTPHFLPLFTPNDGRPPREKGVDVWLALEAFDLAHRKGLNVVVLVTGDGDYVPLVRKLNGLGTRVLVTAWDLQDAEQRFGTTRTAQGLIDEVTYPVMMGNIIDDRSRAGDPLISNLFVNRPAVAPAYQPSPAAPSPAAAERPSRFVGEATAAPAPEADGNAQPSAGAGTGENQEQRAPWRPNRPPGMEESEPAREQGYIANMPIGREFGFIESDFGGERMFFHQSWVEGCSFNDLQPGDRVEFTPDANPRDGRPVAMRVVRQQASGSQQAEGE